MSGSLPVIPFFGTDSADPTQATGFCQFVRQTMGISVTVLPLNYIYLTYAYNTAIDIVNLYLACASQTLYGLAVYNLAGSNLLHYCPDQAGQNYFTNLRSSAGYGINDFVAGTIQSTADVSTSESLSVPDWTKSLTIADLSYLQDPYGRAYLAIAQRFGPLWGLS